jgi:hypothetical protein
VIDHVTYEVAEDVLKSEELGQFFRDLGMLEAVPDPKIEKHYNVRWFSYLDEGTIVHVVARAKYTIRARLWDHLCIKTSPECFGELARSKWLERDSGSGRIWLEGPGGIRVEVNKWSN